MHKKTLDILHIDIENGYGGSSRSLSYLVNKLKDHDIKSEIWIASPGPALKRNKKNNIKCKINKNINYLIPVRKRNVLNLIISIPKIFKLFKLANHIKLTNHDLLHLNHEGLLILALILRLFGYKKKIVIHKRGITFINYFSKIYFKLSRYVDAFIFITENEKLNFFELVKNYQTKYTIIFNSFDCFTYIKNKRKKTYNVIYLGSFNYYKAPDRIISLAYHTKLHNLPLKYTLFGKGNEKKYIFKKNEINTNFLKNKIKKLNLSDIVDVKNQTEEPEKALIKADILIRPSRKNDNWGRDIIEAMSTGKFIVSTGLNEYFIKNNVSGIVISKWNNEEILQILKFYLKNISKFNKIRLNAHFFAKQNFDATENAKKVKKFFYSLF